MSFSLLYDFLSWLLTGTGIGKILEKCDEKPYYGFIPGYRYYKLGTECGREKDAVQCMIFDIARTVLYYASFFISEESSSNNLLVMVRLTCAIALIVFEVRILNGLQRTFNLNVKWVIAWLLAPGITSNLIGWQDKYKPVNLGKVSDEERLAGTMPAQLGAAVDDDESDDGLVIHVRSRKVHDFGKTRYLLKDINLTIPNGDLVLLLGGSGAGKTTLVNAINGYEKADAEIKLNGVDIYKDYNEAKYNIGFVPQQDLLRMNDTVTKTLSDAAMMRLPTDVTAREMKERIDSVTDLLGLSGRQDGLVAKKSGGQRRRISIGMELIGDPDLFILDEPDSGLDGVIARELFERLRVIADSGKIVLAITHTPDRVIDLFEKVIVLARDSGRVGRLAFYGTPEEAREFFGKETMEQIVMAVNNKDEGGEGRADEFIEKYARLTAERGTAVNE